MPSHQLITSADTSIRQVPALFKWMPKIPGSTNLDYGGGGYDRGTEYLAGFGVENLVLDPFNRSEAHNAQVSARLHRRLADTATLANVLNAISEPYDRKLALVLAKGLVKRSGVLYLACYRGKGDRPGPTRKGWQENRPVRSYLDEVRRVFPRACLQAGYIVAPWG